MNINYDIVTLDKNEICEVAVLQNIKQYCKSKICCGACIFIKDEECTVAFNVCPPESWILVINED